jgi:HNH endonuclease
MRDNGRGLVHYGIAFGFVSAPALRNFTKELQNTLVLASPMAPGRELKDEMQKAETESTVLAKARVGQGRFRADLLSLWQGHCALTGVSAPELLRASHIKSWAGSNNRERLDVFNGLLLAVHLDALFDRALITFQDSGEMVVSKRLSAHERDVFGLAPPPRKLLLNVPHLEYLRHHQDRFGANERKCRL